jgi:hypothetical protein
MKKKAQYPLEGIYYFIPDKNSWDIMIDTPEGIDTQHDEFWENSVVPELVSRYHLSTKQSDNLKLVPYGLPRGRVQSPGGHGYQDAGWIVWHGGDTPVGGQNKILDQFDLVELNQGGKVEFKYDSHEVVQPLHRNVVMEILFNKKKKIALLGEDE